MNLQPLLLAAMALLTCISIIVLILNLVAWRQSRQLLDRLAEQPAGPPAETAGHHQINDMPVSLLVSTLNRLERRLIQLEESLKERPASRPSPAPAFNPDPETDPRYDRAQQLIQASQSAEQVARGSGLTLYEAELLLRIHRGQ
ncbi:DUF2802 domain-containing protein [Frateuria aurantia]|uniref:DUF2802 domain-containing protein n=1 Tax=Frateuria aurantia (strain ATCC 33424 / DSM 6220 / KCTC 2777 / LMG 1558 / NBRC 3245 / NCIMB 13370) TaxID=767434 RepID=H8L3G4_FRAAD|nr:DUF2802 domain-containing protein [Frateuria aurantia]AFC86486.1 Protein of unknown function (DUF2802) [Frateuria aurantia DSM 6220]